MKFIYFILGITTLFLSSSCNTTRLIKPLDKGDILIGIDAGGPLVASSPLPLTSLSIAYGLKDNLSIFGGINTTILGYQSLELDLGVNYGLFAPNKHIPGVSFNGVLNPILDFRDYKLSLYPETTFNVYWQIKNKHFPYLGFSSWYDITYKKTELDKGKLIHPTIQFGYNYETRRWIWGLEGKWLNLNKELSIPQVEHNSIGGKGALGVYLKIAYKISSDVEK